MAPSLAVGRVQQLSTIGFAAHGIAGVPLARLPLCRRPVRLSLLAAVLLTCIAKCRGYSKAYCRIRTNVGVASVF